MKSGRRFSAAAVALFALPAFAQDGIVVTRGPYLQQGTPTSVTVRWRTDVATDSRVRYGPAPDNLSSTLDDSAMTSEHVVSLSGLSPNTLYYYSIGTTTAVLAGGDADHFFRTPPPAGTAVPARVWVLGDSGTAGPTGSSAAQTAVNNAYTAFTGTTHTNLWLMLGDNAYNNGTDVEFQNAVFNMYPGMLRKSVLWPTRGNHETDAGGTGSTYYSIFTLPTNAEAGGVASATEAYYSFDYGNVHFVCLDSEGTVLAGPSAINAMKRWLEDDLAATLQDWIIAYWHHPPYSKGSHDSDTESQLVEMRRTFLPILEDAGVDLVLAGHSHSYERSYLIDGHYGLSGTFHDGLKKNAGNGRLGESGAYHKSVGTAPHDGAVYAVAGVSGQISGGALNHPAMVVSLNTLGSMVLDFDGGRLDATFLQETGAVGDTFTILKTDLVRRLSWGVSGSGTVSRSPTGSNGSDPSTLGTSDYASGTTVTLTARPGSGQTFLGWDGPVANPSSSTTPVALNANASVTARFSGATTRTLTWSVEGSGAVSRSPAGSHPFTLSAGGVSDYADGQMVTITAVPAPGQTFVNWNGPVANPASATTTVLIDAGKTVIARFTGPTLRTLTWSVTGTGTVGRSPTGSDPLTPSAAGTSDYGQGTTVAITALPGAGQNFAGWSGPVADPASAATTVQLGTSEAIVANFIPAPRTLDWSVVGSGALTRSPAGSNSTVTSSSGNSSYPHGTSVTLTAEPATGQQFTGWTGPVASAGSLSTTVLMDADRAVVANFTPIPRTLTWSVAGSGTVSRSPTGSNATSPSASGLSSYNEGTSVTLTATPATGHQFEGWTGPVSNPSSAATTVLMDADRSVVATFTPIPRTLTWAVEGAGTVSRSPPGSNAASPSEAGSSDYPHGTTVTLAANAPPGQAFSRWTGPVADPASPTTTVLMDDPRAVAAHFEPAGLKVEPAAGFSSAGPAGGPFDPSGTTYLLRNPGTHPVNWTATWTAAWLTLSPSSGTLAGGESVGVTVSLGAAADTLPAGNHDAPVTFTNATNGKGDATRLVTLSVGGLWVSDAGRPLVSEGGEGGPFAPPEASYTVTNTGTAPVEWTAVPGQPWMQVSPANGTLAAGASTTVRARFGPDAALLPEGAYAGQVAFTNVTDGIGTTGRDVDLTVTAAVPPPPGAPSSGSGGGCGSVGLDLLLPVALLRLFRRRPRSV